MLQLPEAMKAAEQHLRNLEAGQHDIFGGGGAAPPGRGGTQGRPRSGRLNSCSAASATPWAITFPATPPTRGRTCWRNWPPARWRRSPSATSRRMRGGEDGGNRYRRNQGTPWVVAGIVTAIRRRGDSAAFVRLEDAGGAVETQLLPRGPGRIRAAADARRAAGGRGPAVHRRLLRRLPGARAPGLGPERGLRAPGTAAAGARERHRRRVRRRTSRPPWATTSADPRRWCWPATATAWARPTSNWARTGACVPSPTCCAPCAPCPAYWRPNCAWRARPTAVPEGPWATWISRSHGCRRTGRSSYTAALH